MLRICYMLEPSAWKYVRVPIAPSWQHLSPLPGALTPAGDPCLRLQLQRGCAAEESRNVRKNSALLLLGDLTYADAFDADAGPPGSLDSGSALSGAKWDSWGRLTSPLFAKVRSFPGLQKDGRAWPAFAPHNARASPRLKPKMSDVQKL